MTQKDTLFIGIDVGGTRCKATAYSSDTCLIAQAQAPSGEFRGECAAGLGRVR